MEKSRIDFLVEFIFESDAIEGITDNYQTLMEEVKENKNNGHVGAILTLEAIAQKKDQSISESTICHIQGLITTEQASKPSGPLIHPRFIGQYRDVPVYIGNEPKLLVENIAPAMHDLLWGMRLWEVSHTQNTMEENIKKIADFHFDFEMIHPFADGNGRTGRAIVYYLFRCASIEPFIFTSADRRSTYYRCFKKYKVMQRYFFKKMEIQYPP